MNKILKRLLTGVLTLATVFTALPTTAVHAAETQYWTESEERVGIVEKVMNDGSIGSTFNEGHMTVEGEDAYCIDINTGFKNGYKTRSDASTRMTAYQIEDVALSLEYVKQYTKSHTGLSSQHAYLLRQLVVWQRLSVHLGWQCDNVRASYDEIPKATQDEVFAGARAFVKENKGRYECGGYIYSGEGQELGQFWAKLNVGNAKLQKTSSNTSITDGNGNYSIAGATYGVFADKDCTKQLATLTTDENGNTESAHLNVWSINQAEAINQILEYILHFSHPQAEMPAFEGGYTKQIVTPTNLVSGNELPLVMGFPKKSVSGLAVVEMADFGRAVVYENQVPERKIDFGNIYHMGITEDTRVNMDLDLLASHCFITGSSGSGKSYATYQLLESVIENNVKIMIIEPAKGEYKQIFGGLKGIKIFTTDPNTYRVLKINPFQFPDNIHLLSHIEQLLQIFNASWPLYAAMPAILKQAVVEAYMKCGWDVQNSIWIPGISDHKYPVFADVLELLPQIINTSDYSADSKGDYKGALVTRVQSMTVGINGVIFKNSIGVDDSLLFDSNVIVDLSELGSDEAIALIMGVLIMKLNEYRKSQRKSNKNLSLNRRLQHVTVLEEAHNLLKRTSKDQDQEGANMVGKSVEMISNSIKEMRTYGEGFIIVDQSPMAVDSSAIENTATKIIMNTPAKDACEELGSALSLNEEQTSELSRLNVGVAAVFQKGWLSPVLMKIDKWDDRYNTEVEYTDQSALKLFKGMIVTELIKQNHNGKFSPMKLRSIIRNSGLTSDKKREMDEIIASYNDQIFQQKSSRENLGKLLMDLVECEQLFSVIPMQGIPTYDEFMRYDSKSEEFRDLVARYKLGVEEWFEKVFYALSIYLTIDSDEIRTELILFLVYIWGAGGQIKYHRNSRLAMICRMLYEMFDINL